MSRRSVCIIGGGGLIVTADGFERHAAVYVPGLVLVVGSVTV